MKIRNPVIEAWFYRALDLDPGEELFIPCADKNDRAKVIRALEIMTKKYTHVEPVATTQLAYRSAFRDSKHWVRVVRKANNPSVVFKKEPNGRVVKEALNIDFEKKRMIELMFRDGWSKEGIKEFFTDIKDDEINTYLEEE